MKTRKIGELEVSAVGYGCMGLSHAHGYALEDILEKVKDNQITEWSCVYNLDDFTVSICLDADYTKVYTFSAKDLK